MKIALGSDHRGAEAVALMNTALHSHGHETCILGTADGQPCDYPDNAYLVATAVATGEADYGILVCGTGIGMSISANKVDGIRAALAYDEFTAEIARRHNDANVLCMSADLQTPPQLIAMAEAFLETGFDGGRHARRVEKIAVIERGEDPTAQTSDDRDAAPASTG